MRTWLWHLRWRLGVFFLTRAVNWMPPGAMRDDLCLRIKWWATDWNDQARLREQLHAETKEMVATWRETSPMPRAKS